MIIGSTISPLLNTAASSAAGPRKVGSEAAADFSSALTGLLEKTSAAQKKAADLNIALQMDKPGVSLEQTVLAMNEASLQFQALVQTRNKLVQAYDTVMNMQV